MPPAISSVMNWRNMPTFRGIDLNDSFVLGWHIGPDFLEFTLEASLWPEHPFYSAPRPGEWTCYRSARLRFPCTTSVNGLKALSAVRATVDTNGGADYGNIDDLWLDPRGFYVVTGEFGEVRVYGAPPELVVQSE